MVAIIEDLKEATVEQVETINLDGKLGHSYHIVVPDGRYLTVIGEFAEKRWDSVINTDTPEDAIAMARELGYDAVWNPPPAPWVGWAYLIVLLLFFAVVIGILYAR